MTSVRVLIVDDHPLLRQALVRLLELEEGIKVVGQACNGEEALLEAERCRPDLVLLDINMPGMNGVEVARILKERYPSIKLLIFTIHDDESYVNEMIKIGASGYLLKDAQPNQVVRAIKQVCAGESVYPTHLMGKVMDHYHQLEIDYGRLQTSATFNDLLTAREREVLHCIVEGMSNKEIAGHLYISEKTVKNHLTSLFRKLEVEDRTQAAVYAVSKGILPQ